MSTIIISLGLFMLAGEVWVAARLPSELRVRATSYADRSLLGQGLFVLTFPYSPCRAADALSHSSGGISSIAAVIRPIEAGIIAHHNLLTTGEQK